MRLAADHAIVPVAVEVVADTLTPVAAFAALVGERPGFLLESAEGDERWGRYSFVGANVLGTYVARGRRLGDGDRARCPTPLERRGRARVPRARARDVPRRPRSTGLPPLHSGLVGLLAYDVVREVERIAPPTADDLGHPDAAFHLIGELLAFDHWRQRLTVLVNVAVGGLGDAEMAAALRRGLRAARRRSSPRCAPCPRSRLRAARARGPRAGRRVTANRTRADFRDAVGGRQGAHRRGRRLPGRALPAVRLHPRGRRRSRCTARCACSTRARTCTSCASRAARCSAPRPRRSCASATGRATMRPIAGSRPARSRPRPRTSGSPPSCRGPEGARRARDARRPRPQRPRTGLRLRHRRGRGAHGRRALQPHHAPHEPGVGRPRRRRDADRRPSRDAAGGDAHRAPRRCARWSSSTSSSRPGAASTAASSATSTSTATSTRRSPSGPSSSAPTAAPRCRPGPASSSTRTRVDRGRGVPCQGRGAARRDRRGARRCDR